MAEIAENGSDVKLYILNKLPTPYTDEMFRRLAADPEIDLQIYHLWKGSWRRPWTTELATGYPNKYMNVVMGIDWEFLGRTWREKDAAFIIADWGHIPSLALIAARLARGRNVAIWTDTPQETIKRAWPKHQLRKALLQWLLPRVTMIFAPGKVAHDVLVTMGVRSEQIVDLPFMVDIHYPVARQSDPDVQNAARDLRSLVGCRENGTVLSMISTIYTSVKGQDIGIEAFADCVKRHEGPLGLLIVGEGPDREKMEQLVKERGIEQQVAFVGWKEPAEMDEIYAATDVVLHPSRRDAYPLVVVEAMSWSKPVVGSDVCGSVIDRVEDGHNGYSFPSGDVAALTAVLDKVADDAAHVCEMGKNARTTAEAWPLERGVEILKSNARRALEMDQ